MAKIIPEPKTFIDKLMRAINETYQEESKKIVESHKRNISDELEELRNEIVTRAFLKIEQAVNIESFGSQIRITINKTA